MEYGSPDFDISSVLGRRTRAVLASARSGETFIIDEQKKGNLSTATVLATGRPLSADDLKLVRELTSEPRAFYTGRPRFRRWPACQNFAIQLQGEKETLDLMLDLRRSGWGFYCGSESYQRWNWVGQHFVDIAKRSFPAFASKYKKSVWKQGAIGKLKATSDD